MILEYINRAMCKAKYKILSDDDSYFGEIPGFDGVWANAPTLEECRSQLLEVLEEWIVVHISKNNELPTVDGLTINAAKAG